MQLSEELLALLRHHHARRVAPIDPDVGGYRWRTHRHQHRAGIPEAAQH